MVHTGPKAKAKLNKLSRRQLIAMILMLLTTLKMGNPKAYRKIESSAGLTKQKSTKRSKKSHRGPPKGKVPPQLRPYLFKKGHRKVRKKSKR
jgi:hypothetical protein